MPNKHVTLGPNVRLYDALSVKTIEAPRKPQGSIPVVVGAYRDRIKVYWWSESGADPRWDDGTIVHQELTIGHREVTQNQMRRLSNRGWSNTVGLTATEDHVYLGFKRVLLAEQPAAHFLQAYLTSEEFELATSEPVQIPVFGYQRFGYYSWLGYESDIERLVLLLQGYTAGTAEPELVMLTATPPEDVASLALESSWKRTRLGTGGFDMDARLDQGVIHIIHRQSEYAFTVDAGRTAVGAGAATYEPLQYVAARVTTEATEANAAPDILHSEIDLPGAEHPQLQTLSPLTFAAEQVLRENFTAFLGDWAGTPVAFTNSALEETLLSLYSRINGQWFETPLFRYNEQKVPRSAFSTRERWAPIDQAIFVPDIEAGRMHLATPDRRRPIYIYRLSWSDQEGLSFDMIHNDENEGAVVASRLEHMPLGFPSEPMRSLIAVLDINHRDIPGQNDLNPAAVLENRNFRRRTRTRLAVAGTAGDDSYIHRLRQEQEIVNHIGGDLFCTQNFPMNIAFVQPSDGGIRFLRANEFPNEPPRHGHTEITLEALEWEQGATWITLETLASGHAFETPVPEDIFEVTTFVWFSGLDALVGLAFLAPVISGLGTLTPDGRMLTIVDSDITNEDLEELWDDLWETYEEINANALANAAGWLANIGNLSARISKFDINWEVDEAGQRSRVIIRVLEEYRTWYRFLAQPLGQGVVELGTIVRIEAPAPHLAQFVGLARTSIRIELDYRQQFSPAILLSDRVRLSTESEMFDSASALGHFTTKPVSNTTTTPQVLEAQFDWTAAGHFLWLAFPTIILGLTALGLQAVASMLSGLAAAAAAAALSIVGAIAAVAIIATIIGVFEGLVPSLVRSRILQGLVNQDFKAQLDRAGIFRRAGTGLGEEIAYRVRPEDERVQIGRNRQDPSKFEMFYVSANQCRVRIDE